MIKKALIMCCVAGLLLASVAVAQDLEILDVKMREVERSENYVTIAWLVKVRNNTDAAKKAWINVQFVDRDGFELESDSESAILQPGVITTITDTTMISVKVYPQISRIQASF